MATRPQLTPDAWPAPKMLPGWIRKPWARLVGFIIGRHAASRVYAEGRAATADAAAGIARILAECDKRVADADEDRKNAELQNSSLLETVKVRDREIELLRGEKAGLQAQLDLRLLEVEELNLWLERVRTRLSADIAQEVAREHGTGRARPPTPSNQAG